MNEAHSKSHINKIYILSVHPYPLPMQQRQHTRDAPCTGCRLWAEAITQLHSRSQLLHGKSPQIVSDSRTLCKQMMTGSKRSTPHLLLGTIFARTSIPSWLATIRSQANRSSSLTLDLGVAHASPFRALQLHGRSSFVARRNFPGMLYLWVILIKENPII